VRVPAAELAQKFFHERQNACRKLLYLYVPQKWGQASIVLDYQK
jgi:hypothetical protein